MKVWLDYYDVGRVDHLVKSQLFMDLVMEHNAVSYMITQGWLYLFKGDGSALIFTEPDGCPMIHTATYSINQLIIDQLDIKL